MNVELSRDELKQLRQFAEAKGMSLEEAATHAAQIELAQRYRMPKLDGVVLPFEALNREDH